jgi:DNA invertase Pin-like site-specific DNA recombinase
MSRISYWEKPEQIIKLRAYMRRGFSLKETALKMGIMEATLKGWIKESPIIRDNLRAYASKADLYIIEDRLVSSAKNGEQWAVNRFLDAFGGARYNHALKGEFMPDSDDNETFNDVVDIISGESRPRE